MTQSNIKFKPYIQQTLVNNLKIKQLNEIQNQTIKDLLNHKNLIGISATGSGKTLAFLLPLLQNLDLNNNLQSIIIVPTRELGRQIYNVLINFKKNEPNLKVQLFVGGNEYDKQIKNINSTKPQIIVATIDRLKKAITDKQLNYQHLTNITIDEADMLSDLGFINDLSFILEQLNPNNKIQITAWSASLHNLLVDKLKHLIVNPIIKQVGYSIYQNKQIKHSIIINNDQFQALNALLNKINPYLCIIFLNNKKKVEETYKFLKNNNYNVVMIHASLSPRERKNIYNKIKHFDYQYIVASDLASRGLDLNGVSDVISLDFPNEIEWYIHRAGRSGRGKYEGHSWVIVNQQANDKINNLIHKKIDFDFYQLKNNNLISLSYKPFKTKQIDEIAKNEIKKQINHKSKVKPNYKKKQKQKLNQIKQKSKRRYLDQKMKAIINNKHND